MKIALLSWESLHSIAVGGVAQHVSELAAGLERRGHDVHVFVRIGQGQSNYELIDGVHYHRCPIQIHPDFVTEMNNMCNAFMWFLGEVESRTGHFDIVHGHDWLCAKGVVQAATKLKLSVPVVVRMEGTNVDEGRRILAESGLDLINAKDLADAAEKVAKIVS